MRKLNHIYFIGLMALTLLTIVGCCDDDDDIPTVGTNGFTYNNTFYATENAYLEIDEEDNNMDGNPDNYIFFFTDGKIYDNDANINGTADEYLLSINSTKLVMIDLEIMGNPSLASSAPSAGNVYNGIYGTTQIWHSFQMGSFNPSFFDNGDEYGTIGGPGVQHNPSSTIPPLVMVNAINIDLVNLAANTMNVAYSFTNQNGELITGYYNGPMGIIRD